MRRRNSEQPILAASVVSVFITRARDLSQYFTTIDLRIFESDRSSVPSCRGIQPAVFRTRAERAAIARHQTIPPPTKALHGCDSAGHANQRAGQNPKIGGQPFDRRKRNRVQDRCRRVRSARRTLYPTPPLVSRWPKAEPLLRKKPPPHQGRPFLPVHQRYSPVGYSSPVFCEAYTPSTRATS